MLGQLSTYIVSWGMPASPPPNPYPAIHSIVCTSVNIIPEVLVNIASRELILQREKPVICPLRSNQSKISKVGLATHLSERSKKTRELARTEFVLTLLVTG